MKEKIKIICLLFACICIFPILVNADMGAPEIEEYNVRVNNTDGVALYNYNLNKILTIPYNTELTITFDLSISGSLYGYVSYNGEYGYVKISDVLFVSSEVDLSDFSKRSETDVYVFREGAYLYSFPSAASEYVVDEMIPVGTVLTYEYYDDSWIYTSYNGKEGWVYNYPYSSYYDDIGLIDCLAYVPTKGSEIITLNEIDTLYSSPSGDSEKIDVAIPSLERIEYEYYYVSANSNYVYITYKGISGWLYTQFSYLGFDSENAVFVNDCKSILTYGDVSLYTKDGNLSSKVSKTIPAGIEIIYDYSYVVDGYTWYKIEYDGEDYWLAVDFFDSTSSDFVASDGIYSYKVLSDISLIESPLSPSIYVDDATISKDSVVTSKYIIYLDSGSYVYVENDDIKGWIYVDDSLEDLGYEENICNVVDDADEKSDDELSENDDKENTELSPLMMVGIAVAGAIVLALVSVVTITLINKKRKLKVNQ